VLQLFTGFDARESVGWHVFVASALARCSVPLALHPIVIDHYPVKQGSNAFTFSRFLIPHILGYQGWAVFVDGADMLCRADLAELEQLRDPYMAVQVVKHEYRTRHPRKYVGTDLECENRDYPRKNWASVMLINCYAAVWRRMTPEAIQKMPALDLLGLRFIDDDRIGDLPLVWNWLVDEYGDSAEAKLLHWTAGTPQFPAYRDAPAAAEWLEAATELIV
jgi:hypothetical protein